MTREMLKAGNVTALGRKRSDRVAGNMERPVAEF